MAKAKRDKKSKCDQLTPQQLHYLLGRAILAHAKDRHLFAGDGPQPDTRMSVPTSLIQLLP